MPECQVKRITRLNNDYRFLYFLIFWKYDDNRINNCKCKFACLFLFCNIWGLPQGEVNAVSSTVGAGGNGIDWDKFTPQNVTINTGESVTWTNPMHVAEPHTVSFVKDKDMIPLFVCTL